MWLGEIKYTELLKGNYLRFFKNAEIDIAKNVKFKNVRIYVYSGASLKIQSNCKIENASIFVEKGSLELGEFSSIHGNENEKVSIILNDGEMKLGHHSKLSSRRVWIRFGGRLAIGSYTNLNSGGEIRCDDEIKIGSYNQISYNVKIWDTNTHNILAKEERRRVAESKFPYFGYEFSRPATASVEIGDDCWIGENSTIFKGAKIGNECIIGYDTFISGKFIPNRTRVINERSLRIDSLR